MFARSDADFLAERSGDLGRSGKEEIAGHDRDEIAPARIHALDLAAHDGLVDHVVVVQRGLVDELDGDGPARRRLRWRRVHIRWRMRSPVRA